MQTSKPSIGRHSLTEVENQTINTNDLWHKMIKNSSNKGEQVASMQSSISTLAGHDGDLVDDDLRAEKNGHASMNQDSGASVGQDEKSNAINLKKMEVTAFGTRFLIHEALWYNFLLLFPGLCKSTEAGTKCQKNVSLYYSGKSFTLNLILEMGSKHLEWFCSADRSSLCDTLFKP